MKNPEVRVTYIPLDIRVVCDLSRYQHINKQKGIDYIRSRVYCDLHNIHSSSEEVRTYDEEIIGDLYKGLS